MKDEGGLQGYYGKVNNKNFFKCVDNRSVFCSTGNPGASHSSRPLTLKELSLFHKIE